MECVCASVCISVCEFESGNNSTHIPMAQRIIWGLVFSSFCISLFLHFRQWNFVFNQKIYYIVLKQWVHVWTLSLFGSVMVAGGDGPYGHPRYCYPGESNLHLTWSAFFEREAFPHSGQAVLVRARFEPDLLKQFKERALGSCYQWLLRLRCSGNTPLQPSKCNEEQ